MKILEINKFNHVRGGADKHFVDLVKLLQSNGDEVAVFAMSHPKNLHSDFSEYFVSRVEYNQPTNVFQKMKAIGRIFWSPEARRKIAKLLDEFKPDVFHIHNIYHQISPSILPEIKKRNIPIVMTVHDWKLICPNYLLNCLEPYCEKCVKGNYWHCLKNKCVKKSFAKSLICVLELYFHRALKIYDKNIDLYIAPSQFVKNVLAQAGFDERKIRVLPHFTEMSLRAERSNPVQSETNGIATAASRLRNDGYNYALYFGRVSKEKNVDELIGVFKDLPIRLVLAGNKDNDFEISNYPNIKYVGFKNTPELEKLIQNSSFVVSASRLPETFGLVALEALKNGKPFFGYDTGAYREIVENSVNGYLVKSQREFRDKISECVSGRIPKFEFEAEKFSPEQYCREVVDIFSSLC